MLISCACFSLKSKAYGTGNIKLYDFGGGTPTIRFYNDDVPRGIDVQPFLTHISSFSDIYISDNSFIVNSYGVQGVDTNILNESVFDIHEVTNKISYLNGLDIYNINCDSTIGDTFYAGAWDLIEIEWNDVFINPDVLSSYVLETTSYENLLSEITFWTDSYAIWDIDFRLQNDNGAYIYKNLRTEPYELYGGDYISVLPTFYKNNFSIDDINEFSNNYASKSGWIYIKKAKCTLYDFRNDVTEMSYSQVVTSYDSQNEMIEFQAWYDWDNIANFGDIGESLKESVSNFLYIEILPNLTILNILLIVLAIPLLIYILKLFLGG